VTDRAGRVTALTWFAPLRPGGALWSRLFLGVAARRIPPVTAPLRTLSFIHFARWTVLDRLPGAADKLPAPVLMFESNFDVSLARYVDAFAYVLTRRFRLVWWRAYGYPGLLPADGFTRWVERSSIDADHYYGAYAGTTTTTVVGALAVQARLEDFAADPATGPESDDEDFAVAYRKLLTDVREHV
jgi:hypothetical protein